MTAMQAARTYLNAPGFIRSCDPFPYGIKLAVAGQVDLKRCDGYPVALDSKKICSLARVLRCAGRTYPIYGFASRAFRFDHRLRLMPAAEPGDLHALQFVVSNIGNVDVEKDRAVQPVTLESLDKLPGNPRGGGKISFGET